MLAQSFKSAADLGISDLEQTCLTKVLGMLERCELVDAHQDTYCDNGFNMGTPGAGCGTPACIGGWVATLMKVNQRQYVESYLATKSKNLGMTNLYWNVLSANTSEAATALRSYLTTGDAKWHEAMGA